MNYHIYKFIQNYMKENKLTMQCCRPLQTNVSRLDFCCSRPQAEKEHLATRHFSCIIALFYAFIA